VRGYDVRAAKIEVTILGDIRDVHALFRWLQAEMDCGRTPWRKESPPTPALPEGIKLLPEGIIEGILED